MARIIMFVYGDITTDARVQRAANVVCHNNDLTLVSLKTDHLLEEIKYKQSFVGGKRIGPLGLFGAIVSTIRLIKKYKPEIVYCHDYYSALLAFYLIKTKYSCKIIYDAHELIIPEEGRVDRRLHFFYWFERHVVNNVDLLVCASQERGRIMQSHYHLREHPLVIPNVSVLDVARNEITKRYLDNLKSFFEIDKMTVVYAGVVSRGRRLELLLDSISKKTDKLKLLIVGGGPFLEDLKNRAKAYKAMDIYFTGAVPFSSLGAILTKCDIGYLFYPTNTLNNRFCASKYQIGYASDDLQKAFEVVCEKIDEMRNSCKKLNAENHWEKYSQSLRKTIESLYNG